MATKRKTTKKASAKTTDKDIEDFARNFAAVMRFAAKSDLCSTRFYNSLADAWNDYFTDDLTDENFYHAESYIRLALQAKRGGAR